MPEYTVALWVESASGNQDRVTKIVYAEDRSEAVSEAAGELSRSDTVKKVISVEER
ncbi:hypothetical protein MAALD49_12320 [Marinobacter shengliensis]|nr:hypothetical protein MAALD49_12320 [Marinobacter shengliensis]